jgi:hypothetical protein
VSGWSWLALIGLGAFHGANPAMGWLFAVALGLYRQSRGVVLGALIPIALGHAVAVGVVALAVALLGAVVDPRMLRIASGLALIAWAVYHSRYGSRHRARFGMRVGMLGLFLWSFTMAAAHGAGLMLVPFLLPMHSGGAHAQHGASHHAAALSLGDSLGAIAVHTAAMLAVTGAIAVAVYEWIGLAFLRRGWINLDRLWTVALIATGLVLLASATV